MMAMILNAFPDVHQTIHDWIAENDRAVTRWTTHGTQQGQYLFVAPTGKQMKGSRIDIWRVVDGKIVEHWVEMDMLGTMQPRRQPSDRTDQLVIALDRCT